ncbi:MAG TPA: dihydrolipoyl dehydrogenase [Candidatus Saccharimonadales bacterium]|nr:dihydrolipoyl dehydrogenase [Candidatus Saccharimonadales bacterium]
MKDLAIIGSGPGGYVAAIRAAQLGMAVTIIEEADTLGGICLNWGCIPSKSLLRNAEVLHLVQESERFGISRGEVVADFDAAITRSREVVGKLTQGVAFLMRKNGVEVVRGRARLVSEQTIEVSPSGQTVAASQILIATGARPKSLPGLVVDGKTVFTSREALELRQLPKSCVIVGGGAIGAEFAYVYSSYGVEVTVVEALTRLLPQEDQDVSKELTRQFERQGIGLRTGSLIQRAERAGEGWRLHLENGDAVEGEMVLTATGVQANVENLGLEDLGVGVEGGFIKVDDHLRTNVPGVFAIGDVIGPPLLAHSASAEGVIAVETAAGREAAPLDPIQVPRCTYCQPQVASAGFTEEQAKERGYQVRVGKFPFSASGKAIAMGETVGFIKTVVDTDTGRLLGTHAIGAEVTELLPEMVMAAWAGVKAEQFEALVHAHPTLSESLKEAALAAEGLAIHI